MAIRVYRVAVVGCPRAVIAPDGSFQGVGKSSLCNRFVRSEAYTEMHNSLLPEEDWLEDPVYSGDHFVYWGAATKHLQDGSRARFQVVEQTEFYRPLEGEGRLCQHESNGDDYLARASAIRFGSQAERKVAHRFDLPAASGPRGGASPLRATQLFPDKDFNSKSGQGIYGFVCVFDPTLEGEQMKRQLHFLSELLPALAKRKRKVILACSKCDSVEEVSILHGSNLANYALKKPIPFVEVSARDGVNVEDAFFSIAGALKKRKLPKNTKRSSSGYMTYRDAFSERKYDINRAKDSYRRLLQQKIMEFSCIWSEVFPELEKEPEFSLVLQLGGAEGKDMVKKMFCLRLIEIKLMEASKLFGFTSMQKKLDKTSSRSYQVYLSEAFRGHPDLGTESVYDYVYSPDASLISELEAHGGSTDGGSSILTNPSTPTTFSSPRNTPDIFAPSPTAASSNKPVLTLFHPRSTTLSPPCDTDKHSNPTSPTTSRSHKKHSPSLDVLRPKSSLSGEMFPPPLPSRSEVLSTSAPSKRGDLAIASRRFAEAEFQPLLARRGSNASRRLSSSVDCLLMPEGREKSPSSLNVEPYLAPVDVQRMLGSLPPLPPLPIGKRESSHFRSMRSKPSARSPLSVHDGVDMAEPRSHTLHGRGHRRARSNPWVPEHDSDATPPSLPPRRETDRILSLPRDVPRLAKSPTFHSESRPSSVNKVLSLGESSLDFAPSPTYASLNRKNLPGSARASQEVKDDDQGSNISGSFEEIDDVMGKGSRAPGSLDRAVTPLGKSGAQGFHEGADGPDREDLGSYAKIEEMQASYISMASAGPNASVVPSPRTSRTWHSLDIDDGVSDLDIRRDREHSKSFSTSSRTSISSLGVPSTPGHGRWSRRLTDVDSIPESEVSPHGTLRSPFRQSSLGRKSPIPEHRPLPPSPSGSIDTPPIKRVMRKVSSGSNNNIYEVIDERLLEKVKQSNPPLVGEETHDWGPPVDPQCTEKYLEIIRRFFGLPLVFQQWVSVVQEIAPDQSADDYPPPFFSPAQAVEEQTDEKRDQVEADGSSQHVDNDAPATDSVDVASHSARSSPSLSEKLAPITQLERTKHLSDERIPISQPGGVPATAAGIQALLQRESARSAPASPRLAELGTRVKKVISRDDMITMFNQNQHYSSSESESESEDSDSDTDDNASDDGNADGATNLSDVGSPGASHDSGYSPTQSSRPDGDGQPGASPKPSTPLSPTRGTSLKTNLVDLQTDLDVAVLRGSLSADSDLASESVKSPQANSLEDIFDMQNGFEGSAVFVPRRANSGRYHADSQNMSDSGTSQSYEEGSTNLESEC